MVLDESNEIVEAVRRLGIGEGTLGFWSARRALIGVSGPGRQPRRRPRRDDGVQRGCGVGDGVRRPAPPWEAGVVRGRGPAGSGSSRRESRVETDPMMARRVTRSGRTRSGW